MENTERNLLRVEDALETMRHAMSAARERIGEGIGHQLTRTQLEILLRLSQAPSTTGELARQLFLTQSAVTQTVDTLVKRGLVERRPAVSDRRIIELELTEAGREVTHLKHELRRQFLSKLVSGLTPAETEALISITEKITKLLKDAK